MLQLIFWIGVAVFLGYLLRRNFRRAWYVLRTVDDHPNWKKLGAEYFLGKKEKPLP